MATRLQEEKIRGVYTGLGVVIGRKEDWETLYKEGSYGKGSFSRGKPEYGEMKLPRDVPGLNSKEYLSLLKRTSDSWYYRVEQREKLATELDRVQAHSDRELVEAIRKESEEIVSRMHSTALKQPQGPIPMPGSVRVSRVQENLPTMNKSAILNATSMLNNSISKKHSEAQDKFEINEVLHLSNEEAFYLALEKKILLVVDDSDRELSVGELWNEFCKEQTRFPYFYAAYVHFKQKGWTPKRGTKFGVDFLLYNTGPDFSHSKYGVILMVEDGTDGANYGWVDFARTNRVLESVVKSTLICYVSRVESEEYTATEEPLYVNILGKLQLSEFVLDRWKQDTARDDMIEEIK